MRWIAMAGMVWGVVLGAINGPVIGGGVLAAGLLLVVISSIAADRAGRVARAALAEAAIAPFAEVVPVSAGRADAAVLYPVAQSFGIAA